MSVSRVLLVSGSANFSTRDVWDGYRIGLQEAGVEVIPYPTFSFLKVLSADTVCSDILGNAVDARNDIDCAVFVDGLFFRGERSRVPLSIRRAGIPTALVATDDPYEPIANSESAYTYRFTNEINSATDGVHYLPTATLPMPLLPPQTQTTYDVSFVGTVFEDRYPLLQEIAMFCEQRRYRFLIAGKLLKGVEPFQQYTFTEVRAGTIDTARKLEYYAQSKAVLNVFRESPTPADSPSPRVFEVTGLGQAVLISGPVRREVKEIFRESVFHFRDAASACAAISKAVSDEEMRQQRTAEARRITEKSHLYQHRAEDLLDAMRAQQDSAGRTSWNEEKIAWIIGCGRTGSTWLAEMLADLPRVRRWHEPYFGRFFRHLHERPEDLQRQSSFFAARHQHVWLNGLRQLFMDMVRDRYPQFGRHALFVKEVNTPEIYPWLSTLFPAGRLVHLVRDPFDTLDSYLSLQKPGSWNDHFGDKKSRLDEANVRRTIDHIRSTMTRALDAYETFPADRRLQIAYEDLLQQPEALLQSCGRLVCTDVSADAAAETVRKHDFSQHKDTGELSFRRKGKAGVWKTSDNFTPEVVRLAKDLLGPLRSRLGYGDD